MREIHLSDLVGIRLHEDRHARVLQRRRRADLIDENGHTADHAVVFAA